jgi:hypothetical protein
VGGERARNNLGSQPEHLIGVEPGRIYRNGIGGCREGSDPTLAVARVAFLHVLQDIAVYNRRPALPQLPQPPFGPRLGACRDKKLNGCPGADGSTDVAAVEDGATRSASFGGHRRMGRKVPLPFEQGSADVRDRGDHRGGLRDLFGQEGGIGEGSRVDPPCRGCR